MKKQYMIPAINIIVIDHVQIMAGSFKGKGGEGDPSSSPGPDNGGGTNRSRFFDDWDEEDEFDY